MTTTEAGAPTQDEIAAYQQAASDAQMDTIKANAKVAECQEFLALAQAELAHTNAVMARLNVTGAELQQRVNFAQAAAAASKIVTPGAASRRGLAMR
jgi:hypothetical protein